MCSLKSQNGKESYAFRSITWVVVYLIETNPRRTGVYQLILKAKKHYKNFSHFI